MKKIIEINNRSLQLVFRGIYDSERCFQGIQGVNGVKSDIKNIYDNLKMNADDREVAEECIMKINYMLSRFQNWFSENRLYGNKDAEIFYISLKAESRLLSAILTEY